MSAQAGLAVSLRGVTKVYDSGVAALGPLDLDVRRGEFVSLLGPSGCGKSTALRLIAGLATPTSGRVGIGASASGTGASHSIGFVFQEPTLMPWTNVRENVRLPLKLSRVSSAELNARVGEALAQVGLGEFADAFPRELSGGMKMRVSLARALVTDPDILLMDEPFAALDEITRFRLNNDLLALWRNLRKTVIFVTHSVFESVYLSQRVIVMTGAPAASAPSFASMRRSRGARIFAHRANMPAIAASSRTRWHRPIRGGTSHEFAKGREKGRDQRQHRLGAGPDPAAGRRARRRPRALGVSGLAQPDPALRAAGPLADLPHLGGGLAGAVGIAA